MAIVGLAGRVLVIGDCATVAVAVVSVVVAAAFLRRRGFGVSSRDRSRGLTGVFSAGVGLGAIRSGIGVASRVSTTGARDGSAGAGLEGSPSTGTGATAKGAGGASVLKCSAAKRAAFLLGAGGKGMMEM